MSKNKNSRHSIKRNGNGIGFVLVLVLLLSAWLWPVAASAAPDSFSGSEHDLSIPNDALTPPDVASMNTTFQTLSAVPGYYQTSEYMIGHVAVGLILPESDGGQESQGEDWTDDEIEQVQAQIQDALEWWASLPAGEPAAQLTHVCFRPGRRGAQQLAGSRPGSCLWK